MQEGGSWEKGKKIFIKYIMYIKFLLTYVIFLYFIIILEYCYKSHEGICVFMYSCMYMYVGHVGWVG